jgi:Icc-related predicted phosphoesterase
MKIKNPIFNLFVLIILLIPLASQAVPLSLEKNIQAILADPSGLKKEFDFIVLGDVQGGDEIYLRLLNHANAYKPLFILNTGDLVRNSRTFEYENYQRLIGDFNIPILHIPGNHDTHPLANYRMYVGEPDWYFDYGNYRFIGLDNADGKFSEESVEFAEKALTSQKICLVAFHKPPSIGRWTAHSMVDDQNGGKGGKVMGLIKKAGVPMVFNGHIHLYDEMDIGGVKYIISAGGGEKLHGKFGFGKPENGFVLVQVRTTGISHRWVPLE